MGLAALPNEACGIICETQAGNRYISQMRNVSLDPTHSYKLDNDQLVEIISDTFPDGATKQDILVWHTHPSGHIGPSRQDLDTRVDGLRYLVVSLPGGEATIF